MGRYSAYISSQWLWLSKLPQCCGHVAASVSNKFTVQTSR